MAETSPGVAPLRTWRGPLFLAMALLIFPLAAVATRGGDALRGLMPDAGRALAQALLAENWESVTVDPYLWNERAIRGWQKAGFVEVSRHDQDEQHTAEWVLMRFVP